MKKSLIAMLTIACCATVSMATVYNIDADLLDQVVRGDGTAGTTLNWSGQQDDQIAGTQSGEMVVQFILPDLGGDSISSANILASLKAETWQAWGNIDVYGVRYSSASAVALSDYAPFSDSAGNGSKIADDFYVSGTGTALYEIFNTDATADTALAAWLTAQYAGGAVAGDYVFLRFQPDHMDAVGTHGVYFATADSANTTPVLTITTEAFVPGPPVANFTATPASGTAPLIVSFNDTSTGTVDLRSWDFGDGFSVSTTNKAISHTYTTEGLRTVQLIVSGAEGSSTNTMTDLIDVAPPITGFTIDADLLDQQVRGDGTVGTTLNWTGQAEDQISGAQSGEIVVQFILPDLGGGTISSANLLAAMNAPTWQVWGNVDVYGVRYSSSSAVVLGDYAPFSDAAGNGTKIMDNFYVSGTGTATYQDLETDATGDTALAAWLIAQYDAGAVAGDYVFFRFQPDHMDAITGHAIAFATADTVGETTPVLTIELDTSVIPEADFVSIEVVSSDVLKLLFSATGTLDNFKLLGRPDLTDGSWIYVPHSDNSSGPFALGDLSTSTPEGGNHAIYVETTGSEFFYGIE